MNDLDDRRLAAASATAPAIDEDLPVVARLIVEIRSDGSRTVARGALEDNNSGQRVAVRAEGSSPLSLALELARALVSLPSLTARRPSERPSLRKAIRGALSRRRRR